MLPINKLTKQDREKLLQAVMLNALPPEKLAALKWQLQWAATAREKQEPPEGDWNEWGLLAGRGFGKLGCKAMDVPTPSGWRKLGDLEIGDQVFDEHGRPCNITAIHEPPVTRAYRLTFSDGTSIDCCEDHLWVTWTHRDRKQYLRQGNGPGFPEDWVGYRQPLFDSHGNVVGHCGPKVRTTKEIVETLTCSSRGDANHCIPVCGALEYPEQWLPVDPWVLGYWLGNGSAEGGGVSAHYDDMDEVKRRFEAQGFGFTVQANGKDGYASGLRVKLTALGVRGDKHVPETYLMGSVEQRRALLSGLLDSDGHCHKRSGHVEFCSTQRELADAVVELARSLGQKPVLAEGRATLKGKDCGPKYRVTWRSTYNPFSLARKAAAWKPGGAQDLRNWHRMIVKAEEIPPKPMRCLTVDSPNHMFLWGKGMIPTHNTLTGAQWLAMDTYFDTNAFPGAVIAPTLNDVRHTCFEGPAGLLTILPPELIVDYNKTNLIVTMQTESGKPAIIRGFSAEEPERLRGPQFARLWCDELAAWTKGEETWDMAMMGLRLGPLPRVVWTTTPKPKDLVRKLVGEKKGRVITTGSTYENKAHLPQSFFEQLAQYEGTQLGRQELLGELIDAEEGGIIARSWFKLWPARKPLPAFDWIIMSLDTAFTEKTLNKRTFDADSSACTVWGVFWHEDVRQVMLLDCWSEQYGLPDLMKRVKKELNVSYGDDADTALIRPLFGSSKPTGSGRKPDILLIEDKGSGISLRQMLDREGITAFAYNPGRADKLTRLHMVSHIFARGQVWLPESEKFAGKPKTWIEPLLAQLCSFTGSGSIRHDDYVDSTTQAMRLMMDKNLLDNTPMPKRRDRDEYAPRAPRVNPYAV